MAVLLVRRSIASFCRSYPGVPRVHGRRGHATSVKNHLRILSPGGLKVIAGGGHNGLCAAAYLARKGWKVVDRNSWCKLRSYHRDTCTLTIH
eukprot:60150-Amorphochlora_amoeboformis.AAC.1